MSELKKNRQKYSDVQDGSQVKACRQPYSAPTIISQEAFEVASLACGKCRKGPYVQSACLVRAKDS